MALGLPGFNSHIVLSSSEAAASLGHSLGQKVSAPDGKEYRFVQFTEAVVAGDIVVWKNAALTSVTQDYSEGLIADAGPAGVVADTVTAAEISAGSVYGWVQVSGAATIVVDTGCTAGEIVEIDPSNDGHGIGITAASEVLNKVVGIAQTDDAATSVVVILTLN